MRNLQLLVGVLCLCFLKFMLWWRLLEEIWTTPLNYSLRPARCVLQSVLMLRDSKCDLVFCCSLAVPLLYLGVEGCSLKAIRISHVVVASALSLSVWWNITLDHMLLKTHAELICIRAWSCCMWFNQGKAKRPHRGSCVIEPMLFVTLQLQ